MRWWQFLMALFSRRRAPAIPLPAVPWPIGVLVCGTDGRPLADVLVRMHADAFVSVTDRDGWVRFPDFPVRGTTIHLDKTGYDPVALSIELSGHAQNLVFGSQGSATDLIFPAVKVSRPFPPESGRLTIDGVAFRDDRGQLWQWRGCTDFLLFYRFLIGENIQPILDERIACGFNLVRVLGMVAWTELGGRFYPQRWPDYYTRLRQFAELLAANGLRMEFVVFADAQFVIPNEAEQETHADHVLTVLNETWHTLLEWTNEPFKNIPGAEARAFALGDARRASPLLMASGAGQQGIEEGDWGQLAAWSLDYVTTHTDRGGEWPRKQKDALEVCNLIGRHWPVISDEPIGADETDQPGSRSNAPDDFFDAAGVLALQTPGGTFHSTDGRNSVLFSPIQKACATAWCAAMKAVGPEAQAGQYTAGHLGDCPIAHTDALALRTFASIMGSKAVAVVVRPSREWQAIPQNGWTIVARHGARGNILELTR